MLFRMYNVIFLGDRRIAVNALRILSQKPYTDFFNIKVIVSSADFIKNAEEKAGLTGFVGITNEARKNKVIKDAIIATDVNLLISVQHNWILSREILDQLKLSFNLHNAKLPEYKGYNSVSHAIINRDENFYSTIHWMAEQVDTGDIAYEFPSKIAKEDTAISLYEKTVSASIGIFKNLLDDLVAGRQPPHLPVLDEGVFYGKNDLSELKDLTGITDAEELDHRVRGCYFPPHEPAYIKVCGSKRFFTPVIDIFQEMPAAYTARWNEKIICAE